MIEDSQLDRGMLAIIGAGIRIKGKIQAADFNRLKEIQTIQNRVSNKLSIIMKYTPGWKNYMYMTSKAIR